MKNGRNQKTNRGTNRKTKRDDTKKLQQRKIRPNTKKIHKRFKINFKETIKTKRNLKRILQRKK